MRGPTHSPAQLMELRQTELFGIFNHHHRGIGHIHPHFNERGGKQDLKLIGAKSTHGCFLLPAREPSMDQTDLIGNQGLLQSIEFLGDRFDPVFSCLLDSRINHVHLATLAELAPDKTPDLWQPVGGAQECLDVSATGGQCVDGGQVQISVKCQAERARDGRGGHDQQVWIKAFADQLLALRHAEFVLLINDDQAEVVSREPGCNQGVGADEERDRGRVPRPATLDRRPRFVAARSQCDLHSQRLKPSGEIQKMLLSQDLSRRHDSDVVAAFQGH